MGQGKFWEVIAIFFCFFSLFPSNFVLMVDSSILFLDCGGGFTGMYIY